MADDIEAEHTSADAGEDGPSPGANVARAHEGTSAISNLITLVEVKIRMQIAPGLPDDLGVNNAAWTANILGIQVASGTTSSNGEITLHMLPFEIVTLRIFDTDYNISLRGPFLPITDLAGQQKRFDTLGY